MSRTILVENQEYVVDVRVSSRSHMERLGSPHYVHVQLTGEWQAVLGAPSGVADVANLLDRDLVALVHEARRIVALRNPTPVRR